MPAINKIGEVAKSTGEGTLIIITQRFYRQLITSLKVIANLFDMSNLMEDDVVSGATDNV